MSIEVETGHQVNVYGTTESLKLVAALLDRCSESGGVAILYRHDSTGADLVLFRGTDTPMNFPAYRRLRGALRRLRNAEAVDFRVRPEMPSDRVDDTWRQEEQVTVRTDDHVVLVGGTRYGLRMGALSCTWLAEPDGSDHHHWDDWWLGTSKSVELIMRNVEHD